MLWCCYLRNGEVIVCSLRATQKGSQESAYQRLGYENWKGARDNGIRCYKVMVCKL